MKAENKKINFADLKEQLIQFYEIDIDNCNMTNIDWVTEIAKLISTNDYKYTVLSELETYKITRDEL